MTELSNISTDKFKILISGIIEKNTNKCSSAYIILNDNDNLIYKGSKIICENKSKEYTECIALCRGLFIAKQNYIKNIIIFLESNILT